MRKPRRPQRLHHFDVLKAPRRALAEIHVEVFEFFLQPANADAKVHPTIGQIIQIRHHLGGVDRLPLRYQADAGAQANALGRRGDESQSGERI